MSTKIVESKLYGFLQVGIITSFLLYFLFLLLINHYFLISFCIVLVIFLFLTRVALKVEFYKEEVIVKYVHKKVILQYNEIKKIEYCYSSPTTYPVCVLVLDKKKRIGFEIAKDMIRIKKIINLSKEKGIPFVDRDGLLENKM
jgi:hypothetical protein